MDSQTLIIGGAIAFAVVYLVWRVWSLTRQDAKAPSCGCGKAGCHSTPKAEEPPAATPAAPSHHH